MTCSRFGVLGRHGSVRLSLYHRDVLVALFIGLNQFGNTAAERLSCPDVSKSDHFPLL
jgi:hypothetical protein